MCRPKLTRLVCMLILSYVPLVTATLACGPSTPTPVPATPSGCAVPDLVGLNQIEASQQLTQLGLTPRIAEQSSDATAGTVIALDPPAGSYIVGCQGTVTLIVSSGPVRIEPTVARPTVTPAAAGSGVGEWPEQDDPNWFYTTFYEETFDERTNGFRPEWSVDAAEGSATADEEGQLVTQAYVAAFVGDRSWTDYRVTFGGGAYHAIEVFQVWVRMQDNRNFVGMTCLPTEGRLMCSGYKYVAGEEQTLSGFQQPVRLCDLRQIECDISVEAIGSQYRVLVNNQELIRFVDDTFTSGGVGFGVDGKFWLDYFHVFEPGGGAMPGGTLFRDDFDVNGWETGVTQDEYAVSHLTVENGVYHWKVTAKQGVTVLRIRTLHVPFMPESFPYHFDYSTKVKVVRAPADAAYGLLFRCQDSGNFYYFQVIQDGQANLYKLANNQWSLVAGPYSIAGLEPRGENVLRVVGDGSRFSFWVNGYYLFQATDDQFQMGDIGLAVELMNPGDEGEFEFDNVRIGVSTW